MPKMMLFDGQEAPELVCNLEEAAEMLGVSTSRVRQLRYADLLKGFSHQEHGSKSRLYFKAEDLEYYKVHKDDPKPLPPLRPVGAVKDTA